METMRCYNYGYRTLSLIGYQTQHGCDVMALFLRPQKIVCEKENYHFVIVWLDVGSIFSRDAFCKKDI